MKKRKESKETPPNCAICDDRPADGSLYVSFSSYAEERASSAACPSSSAHQDVRFRRSGSRYVRPVRREDLSPDQRTGRWRSRGSGGSGGAACRSYRSCRPGRPDRSSRSLELDDHFNSNRLAAAI